MENAAAYTMLVLGGNAKPTADQVKAVVVAGGKAEPDEESIAALIKDMEGKELAAVIDVARESLGEAQKARQKSCPAVSANGWPWPALCCRTRGC